MDYKELIRQLDNCVEFDGDLLDDAATAIEALLAEREAAVKVVRCKDCIHFRLCGGNTVKSSYNWCNHFREYITGEDFCSYGTPPPDRERTEE